MENTDYNSRTGGYSVGAIMQGAPVFDTIKLISDMGVGALLILEAGKLVGITREGDYIRIVNLSRRHIPRAQIRELIVHKINRTPLEQVVEKCLELTQEKQTRHLPVMADGTLIGIISMGDLARAVILSQEDQL